MLSLTPPHRGLLLGFASVEISAPADRVWSILTDFPNYAAWNPFTPEITVDPRPGGAVELVALFGPMRFRERGEVIALDPGRLLRWYVYPAPAILARGDRVQIVEPISPTSCRFTSEDRLTGALSPLIVLASRRGVTRGFTAMCDGLKRLAESEPQP